MSVQWVEIVQEKGKKKGRIVGLHDCSGDEKPVCVNGGTEVKMISSAVYQILSACNGNVNKLQELTKNLSTWLE